MNALQEWQLWWDFTDAVWVFCLIVGSFALTLLADAARVPRKTPTLFWQHWWHTPLLIYANIATLYALTLLSVALVRSLLIGQAIATIVAYLVVGGSWLLLTRRSSQPLGKHADDTQSAASVTLMVGTVLSLLGLLPLVLNSLGFWVFPYVHIWAFALGPWLTLIGFIIYIAALPQRLYRENSQSKQTP